MRAMVITGYDRDLELVTRPRPALRHGLALVQVLTCGICFSDVKTARGHMPYSAELKLPHVAGHEICGRVIAVDGPADVGPGDRVVLYHVWACGRCACCRRGDEQLCLQPIGWMGFTEPGGFQEYLTVPIKYLLPIPENIPDEIAPALTCAMGTAYRAVVTRGGLVAGEYVVVLGLGGVGIHAALIAQAVGARVLGVEISDAKVQGALGAGVRAATTSGAAADRVRESTRGHGGDVVIETTGRPELLEAARRLCRPGGRIVSVGYLVGAQMSVSSDQLVLLEQSVLGVRYASRADMEHVIWMVAEGRVRPVVDSVLPLTAVNEGLARLESGDVVGRLVLDVAGAQ